MTTDLKGISPPARPTLGTLAASLIILAMTPGPSSAQAVDPSIVMHEEQVTAQLHALPAPSLKTVYVRCSREASQYALGFGGAAFCSIVYETLLRRVFGGDFHALLAWSRIQRDDAIGEGVKNAVSAGNAQALQR